MWYCINNVLGCSSSPNSSNSTSSDCINEFSQTVAITSQHQSTNSFCYIPSGNDNGFSFNEITVPAVLSHINKLDVKKSTGPDSLSATFLKEVANKIAIPLTKLFDQSQKDGIVPAG